MAGLLRRLDSELGGGPRTWADVIVVRNVGPLTTPSPLPGDNISNRGFNAIVCAPGADATHFLKVRPASHAGFQHEVEWTLHFAGHPETGTLVPRASSFVDGPVRVLVEGYVEGTALDVAIRSRRRLTWHEVATETLGLLKPLARALVDRGPGEGDLFSDLGALRADVAQLGTLGLEEHAAAELVRVIDRAPLPQTPQHGDFWPRNVMVTSAGLVLIDFEKCGEIRLPLYDAFHMVRGCGEAAGDDAGLWLESWAGAGIRARPLAESVRAVAGTLEPAQIEAALVAYLVDFAARLHRRGISRERTAVRLRELNRLPRLLESGLLRRALA